MSTPENHDLSKEAEETLLTLEGQHAEKMACTYLLNTLKAAKPNVDTEIAKAKAKEVAETGDATKTNAEQLSQKDLANLLTKEQENFQTISVSRGDSSFDAFKEYEGEMPQILDKYSTARAEKDSGGRQFFVGSEGGNDLYVYVPTKLEAKPGADLSKRKKWASESMALGRFSHLYQQKTEGAVRKNFTEPIGIVTDEGKGQVYLVSKYDPSVGKNNLNEKLTEREYFGSDMSFLGEAITFGDTLIDGDGRHNVSQSLDEDGNLQLTYIDYESYGIHTTKPVEQGLARLAQNAERLLEHYHPENANAGRAKALNELYVQSYQANEDGQDFIEGNRRIRELARETIESFPEDDPYRPILDDLYQHILSKENATGSEDPKFRQAMATWIHENGQDLFANTEESSPSSKGRPTLREYVEQLSQQDLASMSNAERKKALGPIKEFFKGNDVDKATRLSVARALLGNLDADQE